MSAGRRLREEIARQQRQHENEVRLERYSVCDFCCVGAPAWYYRTLEVVLLMDGRVMLERDAIRDHIIQHEIERGRDVQRFDSGWIACEECMAVIDGGDAEKVIQRWRSGQDARIPASRFAVAEERLTRVYALVFKHTTALLRIHELAESDKRFK